MDRTEKSPSFNLQSQNLSFSSRSNDVFGNLDIIEKQHSEKQKEIEKEPASRREQKKLWKADPEEENADKGSRFKMPFSRPPSHRGAKRRLGNKTPDYKVHPKKWTKYSLEDVQTGDLSESSNTRAAFAFLEERRKLREAEEKKAHPEDEDSGGKIVFKKPSSVSGRINKFSTKQAKSSEVEKVQVKLLDADEVGEANEENLLGKRECQTSVVNWDTGDSLPMEEEPEISFKKTSKKRSIRVREADVDEEDPDSAKGT